MSTTPHDDGGPAFPSHVTTDHNGTPVVSWVKGMTLRDYFAAKAMQAMVSGYRKYTLDSLERGGRSDPIDFSTPDCNSIFDDEEAHVQIMAEVAYDVADAMLAARKGGAQ